MDKRYFSVHLSIEIDGHVYRPGVCYPMSRTLEATIRQLVTEGRADIFESEVRFVSGVPHPFHRVVHQRQQMRAAFAPSPSANAKASFAASDERPAEPTTKVSQQAQAKAAQQAATQHVGKQTPQQMFTPAHAPTTPSFYGFDVQDPLEKYGGTFNEEGELRPEAVEAHAHALADKKTSAKPPKKKGKKDFD